MTEEPAADTIWNTPNFAQRVLGFYAQRFSAAFGVSKKQVNAGKFQTLEEPDVFRTRFSAPGTSLSELRSALAHSLPELTPISVGETACYVCRVDGDVLELAILTKSDAESLEEGDPTARGFVVADEDEEISFDFLRSGLKFARQSNGRLVSLAVLAISVLTLVSLAESRAEQAAFRLAEETQTLRADLMARASEQARRSEWQALRATNPEMRTPSARLASLIQLKDLTGNDSYWTSIAANEGTYQITGISQDAVGLLEMIDMGLDTKSTASFKKSVSVNVEGGQNFEIEIVSAGEDLP